MGFLYGFQAISNFTDDLQFVVCENREAEAKRFGTNFEYG